MKQLQLYTAAWQSLLTHMHSLSVYSQDITLHCSPQILFIDFILINSDGIQITKTLLPSIQKLHIVYFRDVFPPLANLYWKKPDTYVPILFEGFRHIKQLIHDFKEMKGTSWIYIYEKAFLPYFLGDDYGADMAMDIDTGSAWGFINSYKDLAILLQAPVKNTTILRNEKEIKMSTDFINQEWNLMEEIGMHNGKVATEIWRIHNTV